MDLQKEERACCQVFISVSVGTGFFLKSGWRALLCLMIIVK